MDNKFTIVVPAYNEAETLSRYIHELNSFCIENEADIQAMTACTDLPINVMCMPKLPDFNRLYELGVQRISIISFMLWGKPIILKKQSNVKQVSWRCSSHF